MYHSFRPGKIWYDTDGKPIQAHGGSIIFSKNKFWWYGENKEGITGRATGSVCPFWHHGVKLYSSEDLYNWVDKGLPCAKALIRQTRFTRRISWTGLTFCTTNKTNNTFYGRRPHVETSEMPIFPFASEKIFMICSS